jgi:23S rRNA (uracil1939-C5)-methyltransferase
MRTQSDPVPSTMPAVLPGYEAQTCDDGVQHSRDKLEQATMDLAPWVTLVRSSPCQSEDETYNYRCTCSFQMLRQWHGWQYAMRHEQEPVPLEMDTFPIATHRIQKAMRELLGHVRDKTNDVVALTSHWTSTSFASSWNDVLECDCIVTLHYDSPVDEIAWKEAAIPLLESLQLTKLVGRSRGRVFWVGQGGLKDSVYLRKNEDTWYVTLVEPSPQAEGRILPVKYQKNETAFFHPNAGAMTAALRWMLERLDHIKTTTTGPLSLLEMYCGCGAHTVALAQTCLFESIVAVEIDHRLVQACIANCKLNHCLAEDASHTGVSLVHVFRGDASDWAKKSLKKQSTKNWYGRDYSVLLVDPPRMGLDESVCAMAIESRIRHVLYISCGRDSLKRDLERLHSTFKVVNCHLLDLFPRTNAVESLIHLQRGV